MSATSWVPGEHIQSERAAEQMAAHAMRRMGYSDALETPVGPDGGIDVQATGAIAQVKWRSAQTGRQEVQALVGARGLDHHLELFFFSASGFSVKAVEYANVMGVALFTFDVRGALTAVGPAAAGALSRQAEPVPPFGTSSDPSRSSKTPSRAKLWWKRNWLQAATVFCWLGAVVSLIGVFTDPEVTWGQVVFYWAVAIAGTVVWRWRVSRGLAASPGASVSSS